MSVQDVFQQTLYKELGIICGNGGHHPTRPVFAKVQVGTDGVSIYGQKVAGVRQKVAGKISR